MLLGADAGVDEDAALLVPLERVEPELLGVGEAAEDGGQEDAVVGAVRLVAEHADVEAVGRAGEDFLDDAGAGHAGADDDEGRAASLDHGAAPAGSASVINPRGRNLRMPESERQQGKIGARAGANRGR